MTPLEEFLTQARSAGRDVAQPAVRRAAAAAARAFEAVTDYPDHALRHSVRALVELMKALPGLSDPQTITGHGQAIFNLAGAIRAALPKPQPRRYWVEGERA